MISDYRLVEPVPELPPLRIKDIPSVEACDLEAMYHLEESFAKATKSSLGLVSNTLEELEEQFIATLGQELSNPIFPTGPFHNYFLASSSNLLVQDQTSIS